MSVEPPPSFFVALRDSPYAQRPCHFVPAPATGYNSCLHLAPTARTVATLYRLGCDLESRDWEGSRWRSTKTTFSRMLVRHRIIFNHYQPEPLIHHVLPMLMRLGAVWRDDRGEIIASGNALMSLVIDRHCSAAAEELLLTGGVDIPPTSATWDRWLHASISDCDCLHLLLEYGGNPNARGESGKSLLQVLALQYQPNEEIFKLLLQRGADPNERLCAAETSTWTYSAILQHERAERKRRRSIESGKPASAARLGFAYRHDDGQDADDNAENQIPKRKNKVQCPGWLRMRPAVFVWLRHPTLSAIEPFLAAPTFDLLSVSRSGTTLFATLCKMGDPTLVEMFLQEAERRGVSVDVNQRNHQVPLCLLHDCWKVLPLLLRRGLSLDGSFEFTETHRFKFHEYSSSSLLHLSEEDAPRRYDIPLLLKRQVTSVADEMRLFFVAEPTKGGHVAVPRELREYFIEMQALTREARSKKKTKSPKPKQGKDSKRGLRWVCICLRGKEYCFEVQPSFFGLFSMRRSVRETCMTWALLMNNNAKRVHALLRVPTVDVDTPNGRGMYPLHIAAQAAHINCGTDIEDDQTFVRVFQRCRHVDVVNDEGNNLLHHLALWGAGNRLGYCLGDATVSASADQAVKGDVVDDDDVRRKQEVLRSLINRPNHASHTPLSLVLAFGYWDLVPLLLRHGADMTLLGPIVAKASGRIVALTIPDRFGRIVSEDSGDHRPQDCRRCREPQLSGRVDVGIAIINAFRDRIRVYHHRRLDDDNEDGDEDDDEDGDDDDDEYDEEDDDEYDEEGVEEC